MHASLDSKQKLLDFSRSLLVDNFIEISNIRFTPREFNAAVDQIELLIHKIKEII